MATTIKYSTTFPLKNGGEAPVGVNRSAKQRLPKGNSSNGTINSQSATGQLESIGRQSSHKFSGPTLDLVGNVPYDRHSVENTATAGDRKEYPLISSVNVAHSGTTSTSSLHGKHSHAGDNVYSPLDRKLRVDSTESPNGSSQNTPQLPDVNLRRQNSINSQSPILKNNATTANNFMSPLPTKGQANSDSQANNFHQPTPPIGTNNMKTQPAQRHHQQLHYQQQHQQVRTKEIPQHSLNWEECKMEVGLDNLGNTCFMNSALQCLLHIKPLVKYFMKGGINKDINATSPKKGMLATSFLHLVYEVCSGKAGAAVAPSNFHRAVAVFAPYLMEYQQQDSQEFLRFLLDGMSEDLCRRRPNATTTKLASSASTTNTTLQILDCGSPERNELQTSPNIIRSSAVNLPNLPNSQQDNNQPQSSPNEHQIAKRNLSQRLRLETQTMRQSDSNEKISSQELLQLAAGDDEEIQLSSDEDHINPSSTTGKDAEPKLRVLKDIKEVRAATNDEIGSDDGNVTGTIPQVDTVDNAESPRDKNSSRASGSAPSSARNSVTQSLSNSLRGVKLRIKRSIGAHEGEEQTTSTTKHTSDDSVLMDHTKTPQRVGQGSQSKIEMLTSVPSNGKELEVLDKEAKEAWERYLKLNDSIITDIFGGLLQSTIQCLTCNHRSFAFDPFLDLSVPISKESEGAAGSKGLFGTLRQAVSVPASDNKSTLEKCLEKFTSEEILDGDNMVTCEQCNKKRKSVKRLSIFRYPKVLVVHIKRFRFSTTSREKLSTDVHFPLSALDLRPYLSPDLPKLTRMGQKITTALPQVIRSHNNNHDNELDQDAEADHFLVTPQKHIHQHHSFPAHSSNASSPSKINDTCESIVHSHLNPLYDLVGVCNHHGSLNGGHYIAHVDTNYGRSKEKAPRWTCFNDERVSKANSSSIAGPTAYVLFYQLREDGNIGTYYASQNQEENLQHQSRGQARGHEGTEVDQEGSEHSR